MRIKHAEICKAGHAGQYAAGRLLLIATRQYEYRGPMPVDGRMRVRQELAQNIWPQAYLPGIGHMRRFIYAACLMPCRYG